MTTVEVRDGIRWFDGFPCLEDIVDGMTPSPPPRPVDPPETRTAQVYRMFDVAGDLLYIGSTVAGVQRVHTHRIHRSWWDQVATVTFDNALPREEALAAEYAAIASEQPRHNVLGKLTAAPRRYTPGSDPGVTVR